MRASPSPKNLRELGARARATPRVLRPTRPWPSVRSRSTAERTPGPSAPTAAGDGIC